MDFDDPRLDPEAYITDEIELYLILSHESVGQRLYVENCHGVMRPGGGTYVFIRCWLKDEEVEGDFRLARMSPAREKLEAMEEEAA